MAVLGVLGCRLWDFRHPEIKQTETWPCCLHELPQCTGGRGPCEALSRPGWSGSRFFRGMPVSPFQRSAFQAALDT
eukprot:7775774-Alexandrium_andersonii.AAC.1